MAETFNLNSFLQSYKQTTYDPAKQHAAAEKNMEQKRIEKAEQAIEEKAFLSLTLTEKIAELGFGERAMKQLADTAIGIVTDIVNPLGDYLEKYENIFDEKVYHTEIQSYAKQMFFASQAMKEDSLANPAGQNFVIDM